MALSIPLCLFNRHRPKRGTVAWDGDGYAGRCRHCGVDIVRRSRRLWRRADTAPKNSSD
jgi:hypothetical protein